MRKIVELLNYIMLLLFTVAAILQYNDPDSLIWVVTYGLTAAVCLLWIREVRYHKYAAIVLAVIFLSWSLYVMPDSTDQPLFGSFGMQSLEIEEMREALGLLIMAVWMVVLALVPRRSVELNSEVAA